MNRIEGPKEYRFTCSACGKTIEQDEGSVLILKKEIEAFHKACYFKTKAEAS